MNRFDARATALWDCFTTDADTEPYTALPRQIVDDVWTTGATLASCARALGRRGVREVYAVTATRSLGHPPG